MEIISVIFIGTTSDCRWYQESKWKNNPSYVSSYCNVVLNRNNEDINTNKNGLVNHGPEDDTKDNSVKDNRAKADGKYAGKVAFSANNIRNSHRDKDPNTVGLIAFTIQAYGEYEPDYCDVVWNSLVARIPAPNKDPVQDYGEYESDYCNIVSNSPIARILFLVKDESSEKNPGWISSSSIIYIEVNGEHEGVVSNGDDALDSYIVRIGWIAYTRKYINQNAFIKRLNIIASRISLLES